MFYKTLQADKKEKKRGKAKKKGKGKKNKNKGKEPEDEEEKKKKEDHASLIKKVKKAVSFNHRILQTGFYPAQAINDINGRIRTANEKKINISGWLGAYKL